MTKLELYKEGVRRAIRFCNRNHLSLPQFWTYDQAISGNHRDAKLLAKLRRVAPVVGAQTGLYRPEDGGYVFVNVAVTAWPAIQPGMRRWRWPGYKVDRTAMGVVAHELGHHVEELLRQDKLPHCHMNNLSAGAEWRRLISEEGKKRVTSYEPVPSEAFAETMRLFILNPRLLMFGVPARYEFIVQVLGLKPSEKREWTAVLNNANYSPAVKRWIGETR